MKSQKAKVASIQPFVPVDYEHNFKMRANAWEYAQKAMESGARLIVFPEFFNVMGMTVAQSLEEASKAGEIKKQAQEFCKTNSCYLFLPLFEKRCDTNFNTAYFIDPDGENVMTYDKTHPTIAETDEYGILPGDEFPIVDTPFGKVGVMICYDVYFPEVARILSLKGAQIILFPSLQRSDMEESVLIMSRVRAMDSTSYVVRSSFGQVCGKTYKPGMMFGGSCIIAPDGTVLSNAGRHEGYAIAAIDVSVPWSRPRCGGREEMPVREFLTEDRRPEIYGKIATDCCRVKNSKEGSYET